MKRFEYLTKLLDSYNLIQQLNKYGRSGWELVSLDEGNYPNPRLAVFKRELTGPYHNTGPK